MGATTHSIDVSAPLKAVYHQWTQFEEFPRFMEGVIEIQQHGPKTLLWKVNIGGKDKQWEAEIVEQIPDTRIAWESIDGTQNRGVISFESLDFERTRITLTIEYEPEGFLEMAGDALGIPSNQVEGDLKRFRDFIEKNAIETGSWRGQIEEGESLESKRGNQPRSRSGCGKWRPNHRCSTPRISKLIHGYQNGGTYDGQKSAGEIASRRKSIFPDCWACDRTLTSIGTHPRPAGRRRARLPILSRRGSSRAYP